MARGMKRLTAISLLLTAVFSGLTLAGFDWAVPYAITFCTCLYHFSMRFLVGYAFNRTMGNKADYSRGWYQLRSFEKRLYRFLKVRKWKGKMPTYDPSLFDPALHSWEEIAQAMCQAELVHEVIVVLSFLPLLAAVTFGAFGVFLITSWVSASYDLCFVIMQRFNRPRILKFLRISKGHYKSEKHRCSNGTTNQ